MGIKEQFSKIKENWLILVLVVVLLVVFSGVGNIANFAGVSSYKGVIMDSAVEEAAYARGGYYPDDEGDFAPEVEERKITKTASMSTEIERGEFREAETKLKSIVIASDSFILNENVNEHGSGRTSYLSGRYTIKVETEKYSSLLTQLKDLGEVKSFSENARDVTERYTDLEIELEAEKGRLANYKAMYQEAEDINDKINLNDRIYNQERTIRYLEEAIENIDKKVDYSTVYLTMNEEQSGYVNIAVVKFAELVRGLVGSFNSLIKLVFVLLPWLVAALVIGFVWRIIKRK